jgi:hypothetical protein
VTKRRGKRSRKSQSGWLAMPGQDPFFCLVHGSGAFRMYIRTTSGVRNTSFFRNRRGKFTPHCMIQLECCLLTSYNIATHFLELTGKYGKDKTT